MQFSLIFPVLMISNLSLNLLLKTLNFHRAFHSRLLFLLTTTIFSFFFFGTTFYHSIIFNFQVYFNLQLKLLKGFFFLKSFFYIFLTTFYSSLNQNFSRFLFLKSLAILQSSSKNFCTEISAHVYNLHLPLGNES